MNIEIISSDLTKFQRDLGRAVERIPRLLLRTMVETDLLLQRETIARTPVGVGGGGGLRGSYATRERLVSGSVVLGEVGSPLAHAPVIELGRGPGPISKAGMQSLREWVRQKLDVADKDLPSVTYLVARKIRRRGFKGKGMFKQALAANIAQIRSIWDRAGSRLIDFRS